MGTGLRTMPDYSQILNALAYDDTVSPSEANFETNPGSLQDDFNNLISAHKANFGFTNWWDTATRSVETIHSDLNSLETAVKLVRSAVMEDVAVSAAAAATGQIDCDDTGTAVIPTDGETFVLDDGVNAAVTFEFDTNASVVESATLRQVDISAAADEDDVRDAIITAVTNAPALDISASNGGAGIVTLTADNSGTAANQTITDTVSNAQFAVSGMSGGAGDVAVLSVSGGEAPTLTAAVGAVSTEGAVVAQHAGTFGQISLDEVSGQNAVHPQNLCEIVDASPAGDPILSGGRRVWGLLQSEIGTDGHTFNDSDQQVQISFVRLTSAGDDLEVVPAADMGGETFRYQFRARYQEQNLPYWVHATPGSFVDQSAAVDVTLDNAIDNQSGVATQVQNIDWNVADTYEFAFTADSGAKDLLKLSPTSGGDTLLLNVDTLDIDITSDADISDGVKVDTGGTPIHLGVNAGVIETTSTNDLKLKAGGELLFEDGYFSGSSWDAPMPFADSSAELTALETAAGSQQSVVWYLEDLYGKVSESGRTRVWAYNDSGSAITADTNITGAGGTPNISAQLPDMSGAGVFPDKVDIYVNSEYMKVTLTDDGSDIYAGTSLANGDIKANFVIYPNAKIAAVVWN